MAQSNVQVEAAKGVLARPEQGTSARRWLVGSNGLHIHVLDYMSYGLNFVWGDLQGTT